MNREAVLHCLAKVLRQPVENLSSIPPEQDLSEIGLDSIRFIELVVALEDEFHLVIRDSDLLFQKFNTLSKVYSMVSSYLSPLKKCLILDCDNVLWKGIAGEEEIKVDEEVLAFQKELICLYEKGVLLCICSKNDQETIKGVFQDERMLLKEEHLVLSKVNRKDKASNILEISNELSLFPDSFVFADDLPYELGLVSAMLPEIATVLVDYSDMGFIEEIKSHFPYTVTEDKNRTILYREQKEREKQRAHCSSVEEYNASLQTAVVCEIASSAQAKRLSELSNRTNRFNLACTRYSEEEILGMLQNPDYQVISLQVSDIYGDMGIVGMGVLHQNRIEGFMISCRVFDRGLEEILLKKLQSLSADPLIGVYRASGKNREYEDFYLNHGVAVDE